METRVCPASHAGFLSTSLRRLVHNPAKILDGLLMPGQVAADIGCGPGFFTLPMAQMVGEKGKVYAADLQQEMLDKLRSRAAKLDLKNTIKYHLCESEKIGITEMLKFVLAFYVVHEVPDAEAFFRETRYFTKPKGRLLYVEPKFHVSEKKFQEMIQKAVTAGWKIESYPKIRFSRSVLLG